MPRKRGETQQQYMDRLRAVRGLPPLRSRDELFEQVRAADCWFRRANGFRNRPGGELVAFMHIFHPDHATTRSPKLVQLAREMDEAAR